MLIVVDAINRKEFADVLEEMFRLRARVFGDRLGWQVQIEDGMEIDMFDHLDPAYVIGLDDEGHVVSCARALQTTGPHMLADVFSSILDGEPPLRSATIWESTRFCVDTQRLGRGRSRNSVSYATCELMIGSLEYARRSGISDIVTVIDPIMDRVLKRSDNAPYGYVGSTKPMGKVSALAALLDCTEERINRVRAASGIAGELFLTEAAALELFARNRTASKRGIGAGTDNAIIQYCVDQLRASKTEQELRSAVALVENLAASTRIEGLRRLLDHEHS